MADLVLSINSPTFIAKIDLLTESEPYDPQCQIKAKNDLEAMHSWLEQYKGNSHTYRDYQREARRFLLWCSCIQGKVLGQLKVEDLEDYLKFLQCPPKSWVSCKKDKLKKPFKGALSANAQLMALRILNSLLTYLELARYLAFNPLKLLKKSNKLNIDLNARKYQVWERMLDDDEWSMVQTVLQEMPEETKQEQDHKMRTQFLFALLYFLGLRINEVALSSWSNIRKHKDSWWFFIKGKGDKPGHIPINDQLLEFIKTYRLYLGKQALPEVYESEALLISKKTKQPLRVRQLYTLVKTIGSQAAERFEVKNKQKKLKAMSPHWLRHLSASHQDRAGIPATVIQANHRHGSSATTQIYVHAEDLRRAQEINKLQIELKPVLLTPKHQAEELELKISLTRGPIDKIAGLKQFINALEEFILPSGWQRLEYFTDHDVKRAFTMGRVVAISYKIIKTDEQDFIIAAIKREAGIRLFNCDLIIKTKN